MRVAPDLLDAAAQSASFRDFANAVDDANGFARPGQGDHAQDTATALMALEAAVATKDWTCVFDAIAYLKGAEAA